MQYVRILKKPKILFLTSRFPYPLEKGDKLRAYHLIRQLSRDFDISLYSLNTTQPDQKQLDALSPYCTNIKTGILTKLNSIQGMLRSGNLPFQVAYFYNQSIRDEIAEFADVVRPDIIFCHLIRMSEYAKTIPAKIKVLDYMDAFSKGMERLEQNGSIFIRSFAAIEKKRLIRYEKDVFNHFNGHFIISEQDRDHIPHPEKQKIHVIPNGVDFSFFKPITAEKKYDLLFNGHMSYPPNIASAHYTAKEILPILLKNNQKMQFLIAGAHPVRTIRKLASANITVTGWVDDIRNCFAASKVMVAPMLISIGLQNKILQAMAMKIPCVISPMANKALGAVHGSEVFVAEKPEEYALYCDLLLKDEQVRNRMIEAAFTFVKREFSWEENTEKMSLHIQDLLSSGLPRRSIS